MEHGDHQIHTVIMITVKTIMMTVKMIMITIGVMLIFIERIKMVKVEITFMRGIGEDCELRGR